MTKIAHLYHEQNMRQSEIAVLLHISQAKVSRLLKRAGEVGIVRTVVVVSQGVHTDLEQALEERYGLLEAIVADVDGDGDEAAVLAGLGSAGASYLEATLAGGERIGVSSWSQTLLSVADRLAPLRTSGADQVVQLVGGLGVASAQAQANRLLSELAALVGAAPTFVPAPGLVGDHTIRRRACWTTRPCRASPPSGTTSPWPWSASAACNPPGCCAPAATPSPPRTRTRCSSLVRSVTSATATSTCDGRLVQSDLDSRVVGIDPDTFRAIPRRIGLAGGARKHDAVRAALTGGGSTCCHRPDDRTHPAHLSSSDLPGSGQSHSGWWRPSPDRPPLDLTCGLPRGPDRARSDDRPGADRR